MFIQGGHETRWDIINNHQDIKSILLIHDNSQLYKLNILKIVSQFNSVGVTLKHLAGAFVH